MHPGMEMTSRVNWSRVQSRRGAQMSTGVVFAPWNRRVESPQVVVRRRQVGFQLDSGLKMLGRFNIAGRVSRDLGAQEIVRNGQIEARPVIGLRHIGRVLE